jgi:peptidoglycan hydrolase-like protein with peptidoglycan-binding domain
MSGPDVLQLQQFLISLGCFNETEDREAIEFIKTETTKRGGSRYGDATKRAVMKFQTSIGSGRADGVCDLSMQDTIRAICVPPNIRKGSDRRELISVIQRQLVASALPGGPSVKHRTALAQALKVNTPGVFGDLTQAALEEFQTEKRINPVGVIGPTTFKALFQEIRSPAAPPLSQGKSLNALNVLFPTDGIGWSHTSGSPFHRPGGGMHGSDDTHALDLNKNIAVGANGKRVKAFNDDKGKPVRAVASGRVIETIASYGWILVEHDQPLQLGNGKLLLKWYTGMLHCTNLHSLGHVAAGQQIANIGTQHATNYHLHICIYSGDFAKSKVLKSLSIPTHFPGFASRIEAWY